jgi:hypothetical protein
MPGCSANSAGGGFPGGQEMPAQREARRIKKDPDHFGSGSLILKRWSGSMGDQ